MHQHLGILYFINKIIIKAVRLIHIYNFYKLNIK